MGFRRKGPWNRAGKSLTRQVRLPNERIARMLRKAAMTPVETSLVKLRVPEKLRLMLVDKTILHSRSGGAALRGLALIEAQSVWVLEDQEQRYWIAHQVCTHVGSTARRCASVPVVCFGGG